MLMEKAKLPAFWQQVRNGAEYGEILAQIQGYYTQSRWDQIPALPYAARMRFYRDGDRQEFQAPYYRVRRYLSSAALLALIYPEEEQYLFDTQECIWAVCQEYSWCLPAHCDGTLEDDLHRIDLFAAETGFTLAEICYFLEDRLDKLVLDRARTEVRSRVIENYKNGTFLWDTIKTNWAAVCAGNVGGTLMYLDPEEFERQLPRLLETMHCFLDGFSADGTCMEGFSYWHYGFGNFVWFADLLHQHSNGAYDLFACDKVETISGYCQRSFLLGGTTLSNADGVIDGKADRGLNSYLHRRFPASVQRLPQSHTIYSTKTSIWTWMLRNLLYANHGGDNKDFALRDVFLPDAGQAVLHRKGYSFFMKAGHNREPHNHNDVGSFILATERGQIFCDLGAGLYTRQYFEKTTRYDIFCNSSRSHSVPIVNGQCQLYGDEYRGTICLDGNQITVEFAAAYGQPGFSKLTRTALCEDGKVTLTDTFQPKRESLRERFVTMFRPEIYEDKLYVNGILLRFDPELGTPTVTQEQHYLHDATKPPVTVYCIDFDLQPGLTEVTFVFEVED